MDLDHMIIIYQEGDWSGGRGEGDADGGGRSISERSEHEGDYCNGWCCVYNNYNNYELVVFQVEKVPVQTPRRGGDLQVTTMKSGQILGERTAPPGLDPNWESPVLVPLWARDQAVHCGTQEEALEAREQTDLEILTK